VSPAPSAPRTVIHFSDSAAFGGTERALLQLLAGLDRARWRPVLFHAAVPGARQLVDDASALGVPTRAVAAVERPLRGVASLPGLALAIRRERPAVFHAHQTWSLSCRYGIVAAALSQVPARVASAQLFIEMPKLLGIDVQHALLSRCLHRHVAVSRFVAGRLHDRFGVSEKRIVVIPNAVEPRPPVNADARLRIEVAGNAQAPLALTVARLDAQKGIAHLVEAAAMVPDVVFAIAGDGPDRAALEARASALGLDSRVRFLGHRRDVPALLAVADLFVLPSLYEGLPLSVLEAMVAGVPVVATAIGGTDELVSNATGTLVPPADPRALAEGIRALLADRDAAARRAAAARDLVLTKHSTDAMVAAMSALYESLLTS
jgi:glycosyltransferase involved in cell wall biosynthesis